MNSRPGPLRTLLAVIAVSILSLSACTQRDNPLAEARALPSVSAVINTLSLTPRGDDRILWNGKPVTTTELSSLLAQSRALPVEPELHFQPDMNSSYELSASVLQIIKESGVSKFGFIGNELVSEDEQPKP